jgi:hypothetical protein
VAELDRLLASLGEALQLGPKTHGSEWKRQALERLLLTGRSFRRTLHDAVHARGLARRTLPSTDELAEWRSLAMLCVDDATRRSRPAVVETRS